MRVNVQVKELGKRIQTVRSIPCELGACPATLRELIICMVDREVAGYNDRLRNGEQDKLLSEAEIEDMHHIGKIAFGISFGQKEADLPKAVNAALLAFADGLCRFFINEREITGLDAPLHLCEGDTITIIRLTMLTGGFF